MKECQRPLKSIKNLMFTSPVPCMSMANEKFEQESDAIKMAPGDMVFQIHQGQWALTTYYQKKITTGSANVWYQGTRINRFSLKDTQFERTTQASIF